MAAYVKTQTPMDERSMQILQRQVAFLEKECECEKLVAEMFSAGLFDHDDMEKIRGEKTRLDQNKLFLSKLMHRGPQAFPVFLKALEENQQKHIADRLREDEDNLRTQSQIEPEPPSVEMGKIGHLEREVTAVKVRVDRLEGIAELKELHQKLQDAEEREIDLKKLLLDMKIREEQNTEETRQVKKNLTEATDEIEKLRKRIKTKEDAISSMKREMKEQKRVIDENEKLLRKQGQRQREQGKRIAEQAATITELKERALPPEGLEFVMKMMAQQKTNVAVVKPYQATARAEASLPKIPILYRARQSGDEELRDMVRRKDAANKRKTNEARKK